MRYAIELSAAGWHRSGDLRGAVSRTLALAREADEAGFDTLWVSEDPNSWDAFAVLAAIAGVTERIRLGTAVVNPFLRHPASIAASAATLDRLSDGRAVIGLGRGQSEWLRGGLGIASARPVAALEETVALLRQWGAGEMATSDGPFAVPGWRRSIPTVAGGGPPIYLAAMGDQALAAAGRKADGVVFNDLTSMPYMSRAIRIVRDAAKAAGRDPAALRFVARPGLAVVSDPIPVLRMYQRTLALISTLPGMAAGYALPGWDVASMVAAAQAALGDACEAAEHEGFTAIRRSPSFEQACAAFPERYVEALGMCGDIVQISEKVCMLQELGISDLVIAARYLPHGGHRGHYLRALVGR
jgi:5,10-methylenetetrahydromethanopterin reductase